MGALKTGVYSYVTVEQADAYVKARYEGHDIWAAWNALPEPAKEIALIAACIELDTLPFTGQKRSRSQALMFPRYPGCELVPDDIAAAQIEIALIPYDAATRRLIESRDRRAGLISQGVRAYTIGKLSETLTEPRSPWSGLAFMASPKIARLVDPWLKGGYMVC